MPAFLRCLIFLTFIVVNHNSVNAQLQKPENYSKFDARLLQVKWYKTKVLTLDDNHLFAIRLS